MTAQRTALDPSPLLSPRSVAVVGASDRPGSYGDNVLQNLAAAGYDGAVWGVNPNRDEVHGRPCVAGIADLPEPVDAVVVAIPAPGVAPVLAEAIERRCGGAVVISAGFGEIETGAAMERELTELALAGGLPVCGPNCDGIVSVPGRAPLWGDSVEHLREGPVALISQSGNLAVNALGMRRGIGFHTVVSTGNQAVLEAGDWIDAVARLDGVRSIALFLEEDGDGAAIARALARCAEREVGVAVLKVGSSEAGARAAGAHTGAVAGDQRVFSALLEEAGAAEARDPQELLELARCLAATRPRAAAAGGLAVLTCSGGDSGLAADLAEREGLPLPELAPETRARLVALLPAAATIGNPLDYTTLLWDETEILERVAEAVGSDPGIGRLLLLFDEPEGLSATAKPGWDAVRGALLAGAERSGAEPLLASTVPDLLPERSALELAERGIAAAAGLREAIRCAAALSSPAPTPAASSRSPHPRSAVPVTATEPGSERRKPSACSPTRGFRCPSSGSPPGPMLRSPWRPRSGGPSRSSSPAPACATRARRGRSPSSSRRRPRSAPRPSAFSPCPRRAARPSWSRLWPAARSSC